MGVACSVCVCVCVCVCARTHMGDMRNVYKIWVGKPEREKPLG
jgi:hypothetical protein